MKKLLTILILVLLLAFSMTVTSFAVETEDDLLFPNAGFYGIEKVLEDGTTVFIDSSYADVLETEDIPAKTPFGKLKASSDSPVYEAEDILDAGAYLRKNIKERVATIRFSVPCESEADLKTVREQCWAAAFIHTGAGDEGDYLRKNQGGYSLPKPTFSDGRATYFISPKYFTTREEESAVTEEVNRLIDSFDFSDTTTDYQKIRAIYDYLCQNVCYDGSPDDGTYKRYTTYAALINKCALCQGYASAFYRLAVESGLQARFITGWADGAAGPENHGWNIVELDGTWYYVDATWDAVRIQANEGYVYFLRGSKEGEFEKHTPGEYTSGVPADLPEEWELLSVESYAIPLEILKQPVSQTVHWGDSPLFCVAVIGNDLKYAWTAHYGNGGRGSGFSSVYRMGGKTGITASNRNTYDGTTLYCVITDGEGNSVTTDTVTLAVEDPVARLAGYTLSGNGDIAINFYLDLSQDVLEKNNAYMHFTIPGETEKEVDIPVTEGEPKTMEINGEKVTYYRFTACVAAKDMTQPIRAEFFYDSNYRTVDKCYTVKKYADYILNHTESYTDKAVAMVQAMLNYGGYAQTNFKYHMDEMANADLEDTSLPELEIPADYDYKTSGSLEGVCFKGSKLVLRTNALIWLYFQMDRNPSDYSITVDGVPVVPTESNLEDGWVRVGIPSVPASKLDHIYAVKITEVETEEALEVDYSAYSNIRSVLENHEKYKNTEVDMLKALFVFGEKNRAYFSK